MDSGLRGRVCFLSHPSNSACQINKKILKKKKEEHRNDTIKNWNKNPLQNGRWYSPQIDFDKECGSRIKNYTPIKKALVGWAKDLNIHFIKLHTEILSKHKNVT